jgi:hypothetical protein
MKRSNYQGYIDQLQQRKEELENQVDAKDPFNSGVMKAIESSKASLGLSRDQEHKAIRKGINTFSARLSEKFGNPFIRRKGFVDNLASVAPAASAGLEAYDDAEDEIKHDNQKMYEWAKKFRDDELKRLEATDKEGYDRYMADKKLELEEQKLAEMKAYHQGLLNNKGGAIKEYNGKLYTSLNRKQQDKADDEAKEAHAVKHDFENIRKLYNNLKDITKKNITPAVGALSLVTNPVKDVTGRVFKAKKLQEETAARKLLFAELGKFTVASERVLKGGVLGQGMYDRLKDMYPNEGDDLPTFEDKMNYLDKNFKELSEVADIRSKHGINYNFGDYAPSTLNAEETLPNSTLNKDNRTDTKQGEFEEWVKIQAPSGAIEDVYFEDVPKALSKPGYRRVQ